MKSLIDQQPDPERDATYADEIVEALKQGAYFEDACAYAGVTKQTGHNWLNRGRDAIAFSEETEKAVPAVDRPYVDFLDAATRAKARARYRALLLIRRAAEGQSARPATDELPAQAAVLGDWRAAAWFLERTAPQLFGRSSRVDLRAAGQDGEPRTLEDLVAELVADEGEADAS